MTDEVKLLPPDGMRQLASALSDIKHAADKLENIGIVCGDLDRAIEKLTVARDGDVVKPLSPLEHKIAAKAIDDEMFRVQEIGTGKGIVNSDRLADAVLGALNKAGFVVTCAPAPREDGWRPIEMLPENTPALLYAEYEPRMCIGSFRWKEIVEDELISDHPNAKGGRRKVFQEKVTREREWDAENWGATHWRPLPSPPAEKEGE